VCVCVCVCVCLCVCECVCVCVGVRALWILLQRIELQRIPPVVAVTCACVAFGGGIYQPTSTKFYQPITTTVFQPISTWLETKVSEV
jgi:hypothetical protein